MSSTPPLSSSEAILNNLCQHGFSIQPNFLPPSLAEELRLSAEAFRQADYFQKAGVGVNQQFTIDTGVRSDFICWLKRDSESQAVQAYFEHMDQLQESINRHLFLGIVGFEAHFAIYPPGSHYRRHVDQFQDQDTRIVSAVLYLNPDWQESFGGSLKLYAKEGDQCLAQLLPRFNTLVCFLSDTPHEVLTAHQRRYSITGWFHRRHLNAPLKQLLTVE